MSERPFLSVVIPVFEGESVIRPTIDAVQEHARSRGWSVEIVVGYSRGSDRTHEVLEQARAAYGNVFVVDTTDAFGKGGAVREAMRRANGALRCFIDADNGASFDQIDTAIELVEGAAIVIGSRYTSGGSAGRRSLPRTLLSRGGNLLFRLLLGLRFADTRAPLKLYRGDVAARLFPALRLNGFGFDTELLFLAEKLGYRVVEFPVRWEAGPETTIRVPRDAVRSIAEIAQVRWNWLRGTYRTSLSDGAAPPARPRAENSAAPR